MKVVIYLVKNMFSIYILTKTYKIKTKIVRKSAIETIFILCMYIRIIRITYKYGRHQNSMRWEMAHLKLNKSPTDWQSKCALSCLAWRQQKYRWGWTKKPFVSAKVPNFYVIANLLFYPLKHSLYLRFGFGCSVIADCFHR